MLKCSGAEIKNSPTVRSDRLIGVYYFIRFQGTLTHCFWVSDLLGAYIRELKRDVSNLTYVHMFCIIGWWYGVVGHVENCSRVTRRCRCHLEGKRIKPWITGTSSFSPVLTNLLNSEQNLESN